MQMRKPKPKSKRTNTLKIAKPAAVLAVENAAAAILGVIETARQFAPQPPAPPPPQVKYPDHKGTPLRPEQFPSVEQAANLAGILANGQPPQTDAAASKLTEAALRLWRTARDQINEQRAMATNYWVKMDENENGKAVGWERVRIRLELLGALDYLDRNSVTWDEAAALLWKDANPRDRDRRLSALVSAHMAGNGNSFWRQWTVKDFREYGFCPPFGFETLI